MHSIRAWRSPRRFRGSFPTARTLGNNSYLPYLPNGSNNRTGQNTVFASTSASAICLRLSPDVKSSRRAKVARRTGVRRFQIGRTRSAFARIGRRPTQLSRQIPLAKGPIKRPSAYLKFFKSVSPPVRLIPKKCATRSPARLDEPAFRRARTPRPGQEIITVGG